MRPGRPRMGAMVVSMVLLAAAGCGGGGGSHRASFASTSVPVAPSTSSTPTFPPGPAVAISSGNPARRVVALTFDAGSDTGFAAQILDNLKAHGIKATFGITGLWATQNPDLVKRMVAEGHQLMNHTFDHKSFTGVSTHSRPLTTAERIDEIKRTEDVVRQISGVDTKPWFRPPYGDYNAGVNVDVGAAGYHYNLLWTVDSLGSEGASAAAIISRCLSKAQPGAIFLFHVGSTSHDAEALTSVIDGLRGMGYGFAPASEVVGP